MAIPFYIKATRDVNEKKCVNTLMVLYAPHLYIPIKKM